MTDNVDDVVVDPVAPEGVQDTKETSWTNSNFTQYFGYYKKIPELKIAIDMRAIWTIGKGFKTKDTETQVILDHVSGWGTDTFNTILKNMVIMARVGGDAFAEIIRDPITKKLINIKPLDPSSIKIVVNRQGLIIRYEQLKKTSNRKLREYSPEEIFHLSNKRVADEIHGCSDIEAIEDIIKANNESFADTKELMHRYVRPKFIFKLDTDDQTKIDAAVVKFDAAVNKGENLYIPKGSVEQELLSVPSNATLNPLPWRDHLRTYFFQVVGIPQIILGSSGEFTESTAKIAYLAFQQSVEDEQRYIEEQVWDQLYLRIELNFPASLQNELISDTAKDGQDQQMGFQPSDTTAGVGR